MPFRCPNCDSFNTNTLETRYVSRKDYSTYRRRRKCLDCGHRTTSYENVEELTFDIKPYKGKINVKYNKYEYVNKLKKFTSKRVIHSQYNRKVIDLMTMIQNKLRSDKGKILTEKELDTIIIEGISVFDPVGAIKYLNSIIKNYVK